MKNLQNVRIIGVIILLFVNAIPVSAQWIETAAHPTKFSADSTPITNYYGTYNNVSDSYTDTSGFLRNIQVSRNPEQVVITNDNKFAFIRCYLSNTVELIDIAKGEIIKSYEIPCPSHLMLNNDGTKLMVASMSEIMLDPVAYPEDCQAFIAFSSTNTTKMTMIDVASKEIEKTYTIEIPTLRKIFNSWSNDTVYLRSEVEIAEFCLKDSSITRTWSFDEYIFYADIDRKNKKIFVGLPTQLHAISLSDGSVISAPYYADGTNTFLLTIAVDTISNRIFVGGKFTGTGSEVLVFDAVSFTQYPPIVCDFGFESFLALPDSNRIFIGGFAGKTLELDYLTLSTNQIIWSSYNWNSMIYNKMNNKMYSFWLGTIEGAWTGWNYPLMLDLIEYDLNTNGLIQYNTTSNTYECSYTRSIAKTLNDSVIIVTNSPDNSVSILDLGQIHTNMDEHASSGYELSNFPNPFTNRTTIHYSIPHTNQVTIKVYDYLGREISVLVNENKVAGNYTVVFDTGNCRFSSNVLFYSLQSGNYYTMKKLVLVN